MVTIRCNLVVKAGNVLLRKLAPLLFELMTNCCNVSWALDAAADVGDIDESELIFGCCSKPKILNKKYLFSALKLSCITLYELKRGKKKL